MPNFMLLGSIIKKKYPKVVDPLNLELRANVMLLLSFSSQLPVREIVKHPIYGWSEIIISSYFFLKYFIAFVINFNNYF